MGLSNLSSLLGKTNRHIQCVIYYLLSFKSKLVRKYRLNKRKTKKSLLKEYIQRTSFNPLKQKLLPQFLLFKFHKSNANVGNFPPHSPL